MVARLGKKTLLMRDYVSWHDAYDDPSSALSWRLSRVRHHIGLVLDARPGPVTAVSLCAGDGRDLIGVLVGAGRRRSGRGDAGRDRSGARGAGCGCAEGLRVSVLTRDAGDASTYAGIVPADLVLMVGIFGNISDATWRT